MVEILLLIQVLKLTWMLNRIKSYGRKKHGAEGNPRIAKIVPLSLTTSKNTVDRRDNDVRGFYSPVKQEGFGVVRC
jgi:hypothetical protein